MRGLVGIVFVAAAIGCTSGVRPASPVESPRETRAAPTLAPPATALDALEALVVAEPHTAGYDRDDWKHWGDADDDCQHTRQEVLIAESEIPVTFTDARRCRVATGRWRCPYTGEVFTSPRKLDVDHLVPLAEAHRSGGHGWSARERERYANDLDDPHHLVAVKAGANRSKGARPPSEWMPELDSARCDYLERWVEVKRRWRLSVSAEERRFVGRSLRACAMVGSSARSHARPRRR